MADNIVSGRLRLLILEGRGITETKEDKIEIGSGSVQTKNLLTYAVVIRNPSRAEKAGSHQQRCVN